MIQTRIPSLDRTIHLTNEWIHHVQERLGRDPQHAYRALRATLHVLRDRLPTAEAADLAAQLPTLLRGVYWEGWRPGAPPSAIRDEQAFLEALAQALQDPTIEPEKAARAVFDELTQRITAGEIEDVRTALPKPIRELWPVI